MKKTLFLFFVLFCTSVWTYGQQLAPQQLYNALRERVFAIKDYTADVNMRIQVHFMKIPQLRGKLYFKSPDKLKLVREGGLSILPQRTANMSLAGLLPSGNTTVLDAGTDLIEGVPVRILKVVPENDGGDIVLTKLWVDETRKLILRSETTTRDNGTFLMDLRFGKFAQYALPDETVLLLDVKDYKMPKGVTMDYDGDALPQKKTAREWTRKKGAIRVVYNSYQINTGLNDAFFAEKKK